MVSRDQIRGFTFVERISLTCLDNILYEAVREMDRMEIFVIFTSMSPFVSLSERDKQQFRVVIPNGLHSVGVCETVGPLASLGRTVYAFHHPVYHLKPQAGIGRHIPLESGAARETSPLIINCETNRFPRSIHHHATFITGILVHYLHHADIGIRNRIIAVNPLVISPAAEHLAIAGIGI